MKITDEQRIKKIYYYATQLNDYMTENNIDKDKLVRDIHLQWLVTTPLYNIGEQAYYLSESYKKKEPGIEWNLIAGLRHRLVHDYDGTNWNIIADVVFEEIPELIENLSRLV